MHAQLAAYSCEHASRRSETCAHLTRNASPLLTQALLPCSTRFSPHRFFGKASLQASWSFFFGVLGSSRRLFVCPVCLRRGAVLMPSGRVGKHSRERGVRPHSTAAGHVLRSVASRQDAVCVCARSRHTGRAGDRRNGRTRYKQRLFTARVCRRPLG